MKNLICIVLMLSSLISYADTVIEMEEYGGVYKVPCTVNGAKMKFIFDTGASNVCLSLPMAEYLFDNGYLEKSDIKGSGSSSVADGRIVDHIIVNLKDIEIGGQHLYNVAAIVMDGQNAPLLMGQSAIQKLGLLTMDGNKLILHNDDSEDEGLTQEQIDRMFEEAMLLYNKKYYTSALSIYKTLDEYHLLSDYGLTLLADCYSFCDDDSNAIRVLNKIKDVDSLLEDGIDFYERRGLFHFFIGNDEMAISDFEKSTLNQVNEYKKSYINKIWGNCLKNLKRYRNAADKYAEALNDKAKELGVSTDYLFNDCQYKLNKKDESIKDADADEIFFEIINIANLNGDMSNFDFNDRVIVLAYKGNKRAQRYCDRMDINYNYLYHLRP